MSRTTVHTAMINHAVYDARRSPMKRFRVGACVAVKHDTSHGWSHKSPLKLTQYYSIHAELHALMNARYMNIRGASIYVAAINAKGHTVNALPCRECMALLFDSGIENVYYTITPEVREEDYIPFNHLDLRDPDLSELWSTLKPTKSPKDIRK